MTLSAELSLYLIDPHAASLGDEYISNPQGYSLLLYNWKLFPNSAQSHWLLWGHMTSINETVSCQNLWEGNSAKSKVCVLSAGNSALLPPGTLTDDHCYSKI